MAVEVKSNLNMQVDPALGLRIRFEFQSTWVWYSQAWLHKLYLENHSATVVIKAWVF